MNQTVTANISGVVFHIDVDAYERLNRYLDKIKSYFRNSEESEEIMSDIEARIAELFSAKITGQNQVISVKDVLHVMEVMGKPEQFIDGEDKEQESFSSSSATYKRTSKRLFRDPDDRVIGGVSSGIGAYLGVDPVWVRLFFIVGVFMGFFGFLLYLILWIIIPEAKTATDKLNMKGEPVNIENIGRTFEEGAAKVNEKIKEMDTRRIADRIEQFFISFFSMIGTLLKGLFKAFAKILGFAFFVFGLFLIVLLMGGIFSSNAVYSFSSSSGIFTLDSIDFLVYLFNSDGQFQFAKYALMVVFVVPVIALIYGGMRLLFGIRANTGIGIGLSVLWIIALISCLFIGLQVGANFSDEARVVDYQPVKSNYRDYVIRMDDEIPPGDEVIPFSDKDFFFSTDESNFYTGYPEFTIEKGEGDSLVLEVRKSASGPSIKRSTENARGISYSFVQDANLINLRSFIQFEREDGIRGQEALLVLKLPVGKVVYLDPSLEAILFDVENVTDTYDRDMLGKRWVMMENGLTCLDCQGIKGIDSEELKKVTSQKTSFEMTSTNSTGFHFPELATYFITSLMNLNH